MTVMACLMVSAMDGDAMGSGLSAARLVFGLLFWLGWLLGGAGRGGGLLFSCLCSKERVDFVVCF